MKIGRFGRFLIAIGIGLTVGLLIGWVFSPRYQPAGPESLRVDYRADYALMVAEIYSAERDPLSAVQRLAFLSDQPAVRLVQEAIVSAEQLNYSRQDVTLMADLLQVLQVGPGGGGQP